jgi:type IV secretory pathway TraG/TraD family ATPase VirD4
MQDMHSSLYTLTHGWNGLVLLYALTLIGLIVGFLLLRAGTRRFLRTPLLALPVMLIAALVQGVIQWLSSPLVGHLNELAAALLSMGYTLACGAVAAWIVERIGTPSGLKRGASVVYRRPSWRRRGARPEGLTIAGVPVPALDETKHFKLIGTTGTGKSTAIRELLAGALARGDRAVIADPDGSYAKAFYNPQRGDVILNPFDARSARWDLFGEIQAPQDAEQLARSMIPDHDGQDRIWRNYGRTLLGSLLGQLHRVPDSRRVDLLCHALIYETADELRELLQDTPAAPYLAKDNGKFFESVRSVAVTHVAALEHVGRQTTGTQFSVRRWIRDAGGKGGVLFLTYRASEIAALRHLISTWMRIAIFETMNAEEGDQKLWFVIDELDALGAIDGLKDALARLRKFGGRCVLGFQSIAQVRGSHGDAESQTIVENCGNTVILRCSASERGGTAEFASRLIGRREIIRQQTSRSRPAGIMSLAHAIHTTSAQHAIEDAVMASEIEQLPDLTGYLKIASQPQWKAVRLAMPSNP